MIIYHLYRYFIERFPILPLFCFSLFFAMGISYKVKGTLMSIQIIGLSLVILSFFLHLRILDEFKDFLFDSKYHKDRPLQSGLISARQIKITGYINFLLMTTLVLLLGGFKLFWIYLIVLCYTYLMFKEFFIKDFEKRSLLFYFLLHQIVFFPLFYFVFCVLNNNYWTLNLNGLIFILFCMLTPAIIEIGRKMQHRFDDAGNITADTYVYKLGERPTVMLFFSLIITGGFFTFFIPGYETIISYSLVISGFLLLLLSIDHYKVFIKYNMYVTIFFALAFPLTLLIP